MTTETVETGGAVDACGIEGWLEWELVDSVTGEVKSRGVTHNLVTQVGDQMYGERGGGVSGAPAAPTGMKYGTGSTAASKTGAGAALGTYVSGSAQALDATYPQSSLNGSSRRITYRVSYAAGTGTSDPTPITEAVLVNETIANATSAAAATISRAIISPGAKTALDILNLTWHHQLLGA